MQASLSQSRQRQNGAAGAAIGAREDGRPPGPAAFRPLRRGRGHRSAMSLLQSGGGNVRLCSPMFAYVRLMGKKMFEAGGFDRDQSGPNQIRPTPVKSDQTNQIRPNIPSQGYRRGRESCRRDADSGGRDARAPRRMGCPPAQGQSASIKIN